MVNPALIKKQEVAFTPVENAKKLFQAIYRKHNKKEVDENEAKINVSDLISKMAFYYEKIRNSVDYKEEHLLRKSAIERILRRQIVIEGVISLKGVKSREISKNLLVELIRAGYLPNNAIPEAKIDELDPVISKYLLFKKSFLEIHKELGTNEKNEYVRWIISLAASDIEERIGRDEVNRVTVAYMFDVLKKNIQMPPDSDYEKDKEIQLYAGLHRNFMKFDEGMIDYIFFKYFVGGWNEADDGQVIRTAKDIMLIRKAIQEQVLHPMIPQLDRLITRYTVFFSIFAEVIEDDPVEIYNEIVNDPKAFPRQVKKVCTRRYQLTRGKLWRAAVRSIFYIFITKSVFAFVLEVPIANLLGETINNSSLLINIAFPPFLLFLVVLFTKLPSDENSNKIIEGISEIAFVEKQRKDPYVLRNPAKRKGFLNAAFGIIYFITFFLSFGGVVYALYRINFSFISIIIFLFFLALISFFSIRIRRNAKELIIIPPKENIITFIADFFYIPIVAVGKWLSEKFSRVNVFVFVLDFIIEAPFKIFVEVTEEWTKYVKERKDEIS